MRTPRDQPRTKLDATVEPGILREGPAGARATHDHVHGSRVVYCGEEESAARVNLHLLIVDVAV